MKRILLYLNGTTKLVLLYRESISAKIAGYTDADWAGDVGNRKSTSDYMFLLEGAAISWKSNKAA